MSSHRKETARLRELLEERDEEICRLQGGEGAKGKQSPYIIREKKTRTFSGRPRNSDDLSVEDWIEEVERATRNRTRQDKKDFILEHLAGEALEEVKHRNRHNKASSEDVYLILKKAFGDSDCSRAHLERQFYNRKQLKAETLRKYSHALMALAEKLQHMDPHDRDLMLREQFAENVRNSALKRELKKMCRMHEDLSFIDLRDEAIAWQGKMRETLIQKILVGAYIRKNLGTLLINSRR